MGKVGRNNPCPCGSGKKYKKCCYLSQQTPFINGIPPEIIQKFQEIQISEDKKRQLFGDVRPIIHADFQGFKFVAAGNELHYAKKWKTFPDFLLSYMVARLGSDWGNAELKKPFQERHQILKLFDAMCKFQQNQKPDTDGIYKAIPNGAFSAYVLLAYDLYILKDNQALQADIIRRLKIPDQFQGARHELFATATCVRAGFQIEFENEKDRSRKHPEFIAAHKKTGQKIAVESKSKHRKGILGFPGKRQPDKEIRLGLTALINNATKKINNFPLIVFVDTNLPPSIAKIVYELPPPSIKIKKVMEKIQKKEGKDLFNLIVFTNHPHDYGTETEDDPQRNITSVLSLNPSHLPTDHQSIIDLHEAAAQHGNIPREFPPDFNK